MALFALSVEMDVLMRVARQPVRALQSVQRAKRRMARLTLTITRAQLLGLKPIQLIKRLIPVVIRLP